MAKFYTMGCYTDKGLAGFINNPSTNRQAATKALCEAGGAKMLDYSLLRGSYDFIAVLEGTFEQMAAAKMVAVSSGTDALLLSLLALGLQKGDEVITTSFSFISTAEVIDLIGLIPKFVDINLEDFNIDPDKIEDAITSKTKAIIPVSL